LGLGEVTLTTTRAMFPSESCGTGPEDQSQGWLAPFM